MNLNAAVVDDLYPDSVAELLRRWDAGQTVFTIECGGLGPGYEQAIQLAAVEFARACKDLPDMKQDDGDSTKRFTAKCDEALHGINDKLGGLSGAQFGAARWIAWQWCFGVGGPKGLIERAHRDGIGDRVIQCSKNFPHI